MARILIVEDSQFIADVMKRVIERDGHQVSLVNGGKAAIDAMEKELPDLILLDLMMPEMSGSDVFKKFRSDEKTKNIPIIIVTAKTNALEHDPALAQVDDFVTKPFDNDDLRNRIWRVLQRKR